MRVWERMIWFCRCLCGLLGTGLLCVALHYGWRAFVADTFIVPSDSMEPTLLSGDRVRVNKLIFGARIYRSLEFPDGRMECWRTRGLRELRRNDIVVFNFPVNDGKIGFKMNYVYVKRCVALPGDTIAVVDSRLVNSNHDGALGVPRQQTALREMPDSLIPWGTLCPVLVGHDRLGWTIKDMGPVYVPRRGDILHLDDWRKADIYRLAIEFETGRPLVWDGERAECLSGGEPLPYYRFKGNYYFVCGDHALDSKDSRYWGFLPEEYVVGVVSEVVSSYNPMTGRERKDRRGLNLLQENGTDDLENI